MSLDELCKFRESSGSLEEFKDTCRGPGGGFSEQGSERQKLIRCSWRRRWSRVAGEEMSGRQGIVRGRWWEKRRSLTGFLCFQAHKTREVSSLGERFEAWEAGQQRHDI